MGNDGPSREDILSMSVDVFSHKLADYVSTYDALFRGGWYPGGTDATVGHEVSIFDDTQRTLVKRCNEQLSKQELESTDKCLYAWYKTNMNRLTGAQCFFKEGK